MNDERPQTRTFVFWFKFWASFLDLGGFWPPWVQFWDDHFFLSSVHNKITVSWSHSEWFSIQHNWFSNDVGSVQLHPHKQKICNRVAINLRVFPHHEAKCTTEEMLTQKEPVSGSFLSDSRDGREERLHHRRRRIHRRCDANPWKHSPSSHCYVSYVKWFMGHFSIVHRVVCLDISPRSKQYCSVLHSWHTWLTHCEQVQICKRQSFMDVVHEGNMSEKMFAQHNCFFTCTFHTFLHTYFLSGNTKRKDPNQTNKPQGLSFHWGSLDDMGGSMIVEWILQYLAMFDSCQEKLRWSIHHVNR